MGIYFGNSRITNWSKNLVPSPYLLSSFATNATVTKSQYGTWVRGTAGQTTSTPGLWPIGGTISIEANTTYVFRVRGQATSGNSPAYLYVYGNGSGDIVWRGNQLPQSMDWVENTFTTGASDTTVNVGVLWSSPALNSTFEIDVVELRKLNTPSTINSVNGPDFGTQGLFFKSIVTDSSLIAYYDAENENCFNGGSLNDLSGTGNGLTNNGSIITDIYNGVKAFEFDGTGKYFSGGISSNSQASTDLTMECWLWPGNSEVISGDRGTVILFTGSSSAYMSWNKSNEYLSNYWYGHSPEGYHETNGPSARGQWHHWCSVWDYGHGYLYQYVNGTCTKVATSGTSFTGANLNIGQESSARQFSGAIAVIRIYKRALHAHEVQQNYLAEKDRFYR